MILDSLKTYYENILASVQDGIVVISKEQIITTFNPAIEEMSGISSSHVVGKSLETVFPSESKLLELTGKTINTGITYSDSDFQIMRRWDRKIFPISLVISPFSDREGNIAGAVLVLRDMTRTKELEENLRKADRLASLGTLSAGMAHEIKNPLGGLRGAAQLLQEEIKGEKYREYTGIIIKETDRINSIVENLLTLSNPKPLKLKPLNIHKVLENILLLEEKILKNIKITIVRSFDPSLPSVVVYEGQLTQVFLNIIKNAVDAIKRGGELTLVTKIFYDYIVIEEGAKSHTKMVMIEIRDTGKGFEDDVLSNLYTPFFSTKSKGTGLGLAISHKIIEEHKGRIKIQNRTDRKGASVQVFLPIAV